MKTQTSVEKLAIINQLIAAQQSGKSVIIEHIPCTGKGKQWSLAKVNQIDLGDEKIGVSVYTTISISSIEAVRVPGGKKNGSKKSGKEQ